MSPRRMSVYAVPLALEDGPAGHRELALHIHERGVLMPVNEAGGLAGVCIDNDGARVDPGGDVDSRIDSLLGAGISGHGLGFSVHGVGRRDAGGLGGEPELLELLLRPALEFTE